MTPILPLLLVACGSGQVTDGPPPSAPDLPAPVAPAPPPSPVVITDVGTACVRGAASAPTVEVVLDPCGSGCSPVPTTDCTATLDHGMVSVTASATWVPRFSDPALQVPMPCPAVCTRIEATCPGPALRRGSFTLTYAGAQQEFAVTGEPVSVCAGE